MALNLAKRPFVDTRPVNALTTLLVAVVLVLSIVSVRTFRTYLTGSHGTQTAITELRGEIGRYENDRRAGEAALARYDVGELGASVEDANDIARRRSFSWTRFLTRLEETLPHDVRVVAIALAKDTREQGTSTAARTAARTPGGMLLNLTLISRDPLGLPKTIRAFYASPYFESPVPLRDESPEKGSPEGRRIALTVLYRDAGRAGTPQPAPAAPPAPAASRKTARPAGKGSAR